MAEVQCFFDFINGTCLFASGSNLTFESRKGFPADWTRASLAHANLDFITLKPADRRRLATLGRDRNTPHKHVWRAERRRQPGPQTQTKSSPLSGVGTKC